MFIAPATCLDFTLCLCLGLQGDIVSNFAMQFGMSVSTPQQFPSRNMVIAFSRSMAHSSDSQLTLEFPEDALCFIIKWPRKNSNKKSTASAVAHETSINLMCPTTTDTCSSSNTMMLLSAAPIVEPLSRFVPKVTREITPVDAAQDTGVLSDSSSWVSALHVHIMCSLWTQWCALRSVMVCHAIARQSKWSHRGVIVASGYHFT